jgi:hypothetical protein
LLLTVLESFLQTMGDEKKNPIYSAHCNPPFTSQGIVTKVAASNQADIWIMLLIRTNLMHVY